nr:helix-turn-helix transcriptional regulator [uncultured Acetatifactor sp.]
MVNVMVAAKVNQIIAAMTASCMSPQEIADKAGVSVNIVYRMRRGYLVKMDRFGKVCQVLGIRPEEVIDYDRLKGGEGK